MSKVIMHTEVLR